MLIVLLLLAVVACSPAAPPADPLDELAGLLDDDRPDAVLALSDELADDPLIAADPDAHRRLRSYEALARAALGDCRPALALVQDPDARFEGRERARFLGRALGFPAQARADAAHLAWDAKSTDDPRVVDWNERVDAALCLVDEARAHFPEDQAALARRRAQLEETRIERDDLWYVTLAEMIRNCDYDGSP